MPKLRGIVSLRKIGTVYEDKDGRPYVRIGNHIGQVIGFANGQLFMQQYDEDYKLAKSEEAS
jgi:hypothetical protein